MGDSDHFKLPDGPVAIQFSGGRTSAYMLRQILDRYDGALPTDCHVLFQNTGREMPETLDFVHECQTRWGVPITWLEYDADNGYRVVSHNSASRDGEPFEALIRKRSYLPNRVTRFCTSELKVRPAEKFMQAHGHKAWTAIIGIRADEAHRTNSKSADREPWECFYPLAAAGVTKHDVAAFWSAQDFDLRLPNINGKTPLGNCDGCFLKSEANRAFLARYYPQRAAWWARIEAETDNRFHNEQPWSALVEHAKRQPDWVFDQEDGLYCTAGFGGCFD